MNPALQRVIPRYRLRTLFIATTVWCLVVGLATFDVGRGLLALGLLMISSVAVTCCLLWMDPFDRAFRLHYGLRTIFLVTTVSSILLALASFEGGRLFLGLSLLFVGPIGLLYALLVAFSWILGIPGELQRRNELRALSAKQAIAISLPLPDASKHAAD